MAGDNKRQRWKDHFRLVIMNDDTLQEVSSYRINLLGLYILISSMAVVLFVLFWLFTAYTPLKRFMPGYNDVYAHPEFIRLNQRITEIDKAFQQQQAYTEDLRKLLTGEIAQEQQPTDGDKDSGPAEIAGQDIAVTDTAVYEEEGHAGGDFVLVKSGSPGEARRALHQLYLIPPLKGEVSNGFDPVRRHYGIDLVAPRNTAVKAVLDGYVISSDWTLETGNTVCIQHDDNIVSFYKHNAVNLKKVGTYVKAGEAVAIIGNTGTLTDGPHLHFELWVRGSPVNPKEYIQF